MKIAITKIGANITFGSNNSSAANADIRYFLRQLGTTNHDITIVTHKTRNTVIPKSLSFQEIATTKSFDGFDKVLIFNGSINFFGGSEDKNLIALYRALHNSSIPIVYVQTDGQLQFKNLWPMIQKREWAMGYTAEEFDIPVEQVHYLTQGRDIIKLDNFISEKSINVQVPKENLHHYPLAETILAGAHKHFKPNPIPYLDRKYDIGFGGRPRNTYKRKRIEHYYSGDSLDTLLFGGLSCPGGSNITRKSKVPYQQVVPLMNNCRATIICGDKFYENNYFTLRMYEGLLAYNMVFIDSRMDTERSFYGLAPEFEWLYVDYPPTKSDLKFDNYVRFLEARNSVLSRYNYKLYNQLLVSKLKLCK